MTTMELNLRKEYLYDLIKGILERGQLQTLSRADHLDTHGEHLPRPSLGTGYRDIR